MQCGGVAPQLRRVRRHRQIIEGVAGSQAGNELGEPRPQQRFAPGEAHTPYAVVDKGVGEGENLVEGEDVPLRQPCVVFLGHAVGATQVTTVDDREAQALQGAVEGVEGGRHEGAEHRCPPDPRQCDTH